MTKSSFKNALANTPGSMTPEEFEETPKTKETEVGVQNVRHGPKHVVSPLSIDQNKDIFIMDPVIDIDDPRMGMSFDSITQGTHRQNDFEITNKKLQFDSIDDLK